MNVTIYSKSNCQHCQKAKNLLTSKHIQFQEMLLDVDFTRENLLELFPSAASFPVIVVDGMNIGGYDQLKLVVEEEFKDQRKLLNEGS